MAVLIAIEIYHNIILYTQDHRDHRLAVEIVLGTTLMEISRKVMVKYIRLKVRIVMKRNSVIGTQS